MSPWLFDQFMDNILSNYSEGGKGEFSGRSAVGSKYIYDTLCDVC